MRTCTTMTALIALLAMPTLAQTRSAALFELAVSPGTCGENMYYKDGRCVDAREKKTDYWDACGYSGCLRVRPSESNPQ